MRKKIVFLTFFVLFIINTAFALSLKVTINNASKGEGLFSYPFKIGVVNQKKDGTHEVLKSYEFRTDSSGRFAGKLDVTAGTAIIGEVNYKGVSYYSSPLELKKGQQNYTLEFNVYEITDNGENVAISQRTMMITPHDKKTLWISETITIENTGNLTYVGKFNDELKVHQVLYIPLPAGYRLTQLQGTDPESVYTFSRGIVSQDAVIPGRTSLFLGYLVKSDIGVFDLSLFNEKDSPVIKSFSLYFQNKENWNVKASNLRRAGEKTFGGDVYGIYSAWIGKDLKRVNLKVFGPTHKGFFGIWQASFLIALVFAGAGLYIMKNRIYRWNLMREEKRLEKVLARLKGEADPEDLNGYYLPFRKILENRRREIEKRLRG